MTEKEIDRNSVPQQMHHGDEKKASRRRKEKQMHLNFDHVSSKKAYEIKSGATTRMTVQKMKRNKQKKYLHAVCDARVAALQLQGSRGQEIVFLPWS